MTCDTQRRTAGAVTPDTYVVQTRGVRVQICRRIRACVPCECENRSDDRRCDGRSPEDEPSVTIERVVNRHSRLRIGIGGDVGLRAHRASGSQTTLKAGLAVNLAAAASGLQPCGFRAGARRFQAGSTDADDAWKYGRPRCGGAVTVVSGRGHDRSAAGVDAVVRLRSLGRAPTIANVVGLAGCVLLGAAEIGGARRRRFD